MIHFIESVTTYATSGKTRKDAIIQAVASQFEHSLLADDTALESMVTQLRKLVDVCNRNFKGKHLTLHWSPGHISVRPSQTGYEQMVVSISYAPVLDRLAYSNMHSRIAVTLLGHFPEIYEEYFKEAFKMEGGEQ